MNWLKKYWIVPVLIVIIIITVVLWRKFFPATEKTAGSDDSTRGLNENDANYQQWGVTIQMNQSRDEYLVKAQGAGNYFEHSWTRSELLALEQDGSYAQYWQVVLTSEVSADGDFYVSIILAGEVATGIMYIYAGVYDPLTTTPNPPDSSNAKAALRLDGIKSSNPVDRVITVLKSPPQTNTGSRPTGRT